MNNFVPFVCISTTQTHISFARRIYLSRFLFNVGSHPENDNISFCLCSTVYFLINFNI
ncbi:MAG: hypothetical protein Q8S84_02035 [bacterium]|nr:hypothetical protein [bacterium]MDP3380335.1 hypothetical protein [bacterium]